MQAIMILAHKDVDWVIHVAKLLQRRFVVYIHFDTKLILTKEQKILMDKENIKYVSKVDVRWGSFSIGEAAIVLMREILRDFPDIEYIHLISGQDYPAKDISEIYDFYKGKDVIYLNSHQTISKSGENCLNWVKFYWNYDKINRRSLFGKVYHKISYRIQNLLNIDKFKKHNIGMEIYHGSNWMDIPGYIAKYALEFWDTHEELQYVMRTGCFTDEFWIHTILSNSIYKEKIDTNIHRYVKWEKKYNNYPAILDEKNYDEIKKGDYHFIRKIDKKISRVLIKKLNVE